MLLIHDHDSLRAMKKLPRKLRSCGKFRAVQKRTLKLASKLVIS